MLLNSYNFSIKLKLIVIFACGVLAAIAIQYFIIPAATVPTEVMGVVMGIASIIFNYDTRKYLITFWCLYFLALIPFIIFGFFKIGKYFTYFTLFFTIISTGSGLIFSATPAATWEMFGDWTINNRYWLRFIYSTLGSMLYGTALGFTLMMGGSSGGTDFLARYFSDKKNIHISFMLSIFAILTLILATFLFEVIGIQHNLMKIPFNKINYLKLLITFALSIWQCIVGPIVIYFIYKKNKI